MKIADSVLLSLGPQLNTSGIFSKSLANSKWHRSRLLNNYHGLGRQLNLNVSFFSREDIWIVCFPSSNSAKLQQIMSLCKNPLTSQRFYPIQNNCHTVFHINKVVFYPSVFNDRQSPTVLPCAESSNWTPRDHNKLHSIQSYSSTSHDMLRHTNLAPTWSCSQNSIQSTIFMNRL